MKFALRAPILKYTLFGMLFLNSPAQASEPRRTPEAERANVAAEILGAEIDRYRAGGTYAGEFPERWLPAGLAIVDEAFTEQNGLVNSTMKVVRGKVEEHFRNRLDYLYSAEGRSLKNPENLASLKKIVG